MRIFLTLLLLTGTVMAGAQNMILRSPNGNVQLNVVMTSGGELSYAVQYKNQPVIQPSGLSMELKEPALALRQFTVQRIDSSTYDQTWQPVWGEYSRIRDHHKELRLSLKDRSGSDVLMNIIFRVFNEGVGFRYEFPQQEKLTHFVIAHERSQFKLTGDHKAFWIPGDYDTNEFTYYTTKSQRGGCNRWG
jgi:hypothetical protein